MEPKILETPTQALRQATDSIQERTAPGACNKDTTYEWATAWKPDAPAASPPFRILFAEDDDDLRHVTGAILEMMGYMVVAYPDAELAWEAFRSRLDIDLLLTDLEMPGKSGAELAREVTTLRPSLPVMIVSGSVIPATLQQEMLDRQWRFLSKPYGLDTFLNTIEGLLVPMCPRAALGSH